MVDREGREFVRVSGLEFGRGKVALAVRERGWLETELGCCLARSPVQGLLGHR